MINQLIEQVFSEYLKQPIAKALCRCSAENLERAALQLKMDFRKRQRVMSHHRCDLAQFIGFRPQKLSPRGNVEKEIFDRDLSSAWKSLLALAEKLSACDFDRGSRRTVGLRFHGQSGN